MSKEELEKLFLRSLDHPLTEHETELLVKEMPSYPPELAVEMLRYKTIREQMLRKEEASFGPYFVQKVIAKLQHLRDETDQQIGYFFTKFRLAAFGIVLFLFAINAIAAREFDLSSIFGIEEHAGTDEDLETFDLYSQLTDN